MDRPVLLFDGECGFCTRSLGWLRMLDGKHRIESLPYQQPGAPESVGAGFDECSESLQWLGTDGIRLQGAAAANAALGVAVDSSWPSRLYARSSGVQERLYGLVARNRRRLPGMTPWCSRYPEQCGGRSAPSCGT
jgi:predicted DCC family thiol-disulfide oxidoreductase YuxK